MADQTQDAATQEAIDELTAPARKKAAFKQAQEKAAAQAQEDYLRQPEAPELVLKRGEEPSLHVLNLRAKKERMEKDNVKRQASAAAAEAVNKVLTRGGVKARRATPTTPVGPNTAAAMEEGGED